ncbi:DNA gyrase subunit A [Candidatus Woesearchaeota archaeon]|nr:DNA gyrase subunit A [Candidatus Woesearchaeota archaeon]
MEVVQNRLIQEEMKSAYIDYAMSVIMQRALPDVRDGLKPVHRRILYSMYGMGLINNKNFVKSARIVGECFKYHPHGDSSIYDALVRMAQDFSLRYTLVKGHGNFGSDSFKAAHMRYTEAKFDKIGEEMLKDIEKETVDFIPNFDGSLKEPVVLPAKVPNLLINGTSGIAVGMASNIPPHNINEILNAVIYALGRDDYTVDELMDFIRGPDFPTGGLILGNSGIRKAYKTGKGIIKLRSKVKFEKDRIIVYEIPYQINKSLLLENIADLVKNKKLEGIRDLRDESSRNEIRVVIELSKNVNADVVLNNLYKNTQLEVSFGINMIALHDLQPKIMTLKDLVFYFIEHRKDVVIKRTKFDLNKAEERKHILEGLLIALKSIDEIISLIKKSKDSKEAKEGLINNYNLSDKQAQAILDMKLSRLTGLEQDKINEEHRGLIELIKELKEILESKIKLIKMIKNELEETRKDYSDERRTEIIDGGDEVIEDEDLINEENVVITITNKGYIKSTKLDEYREQKRGGKGLIAAATKDEDFVEDLFVCSNLNNLLFFTDKGRVHWLKAYHIPLGSRYSKGKAIINLLNTKERVTSVLKLDGFDEGYLVFATRKGVIKKTQLKEYSNPRKGGIIAINLRDNDDVVDVLYVKGEENLIIGTHKGIASRFKVSDINDVGRNSIGVRGIKLADDYVIGLVIAKDSLLTVTKNGYGKRTDVEDYRLINRGGKGVLNIKTKFIYPDSRNEGVVGIKSVNDNDQVMFITKKGVTIRMNVKDIKVIGRSTSGVRLIRLSGDDEVVGLSRIVGE